MKKSLSLATALFAFILASGLSAAHRSSPDEAQAFFEEAVVFVGEVGADKAITEFNDPNGSFVRGDLYVFALSSDGQYLANGGFPQLAGQPIEGVRNAAGEPVYELIMAAMDNDDHEGVAKYEWLNPQTNQLEDKSAYVSEVEGIIIGVGYYQ